MRQDEHRASREQVAPRLLITGGEGQLGRAVIAACARQGVRALSLARHELDITDEAQVRRVVSALRPTSVIHCAAWTDVDGAEARRDAAFAVNEEGSRAIAQACHAARAHLVYVSTDYVFDGDSSDGYTEHATPNPINVYGESKLAGEQAVQQELGVEHCCIARTAWLFGAGGANFVTTIARLAAERGHLDVVADQHGNPTWCTHLADALVTCAVQQVSGVLHLVDAPTTTWHGFAQAIVSQIDAQCDVREILTDQMSRAARRPMHATLRSTRPDTPIMGDWREALATVLQRD